MRHFWRFEVSCGGVATAVEGLLSTHLLPFTGGTKRRPGGQTERLEGRLI